MSMAGGRAPRRSQDLQGSALQMVTWQPMQPMQGSSAAPYGHAMQPMQPIRGSLEAPYGLGGASLPHPMPYNPRRAQPGYSSGTGVQSSYGQGVGLQPGHGLHGGAPGVPSAREWLYQATMRAAGGASGGGGLRPMLSHTLDNQGAAWDNTPPPMGEGAGGAEGWGGAGAGAGWTGQGSPVPARASYGGGQTSLHIPVREASVT